MSQRPEKQATKRSTCARGEKRIRHRKSAFTLIELLIVISLVTSLSFVLMTKGACFVKNYQANQEKKIFEYALNRAIVYAKMHNCPLEVLLVSTDNKEFILEIKDLKFSKSFKYMHLNKNKQTVYICPDHEPSIKDFNASFF